MHLSCNDEDKEWNNEGMCKSRERFFWLILSILVSVIFRLFNMKFLDMVTAVAKKTSVIYKEP